MAATTKTVLPKNIFDVEVSNHELLKTAYTAYLANSRENRAKTLTRGEVSGGGKKPWRQKGTGRARFGSSRNPIWRKGGIVFGPTGNENYTIKLPATAKRVAIRQALTLAAKADKIMVVDSIKATGKTAEIVKTLADYKVEKGDNVVLAVETKTPELDRATRNIQGVNLVQANYLNVFVVLNADKIIVTKPALQIIESWLGA